MNVFEKIIEKLKKYQYRTFTEHNFSDELGFRCFSNAISIVKEVAEEHNNGWILCSEQMPKEHDSIFAKHKGTNNWREGMFEKASDNVTITILYEDGQVATTYARTLDGEWSCNLLKCKRFSYKVVAWQYLPEPYQLSTTRMDKKQTNYEKIMSMSLEETADEILPLVSGEAINLSFCTDKPECEALLDAEDGIPETECKKCLIRWLQQEVKNNDC